MKFIPIHPYYSHHQGLCPIALHIQAKNNPSFKYSEYILSINPFSLIIMELFEIFCQFFYFFEIQRLFIQLNNIVIASLVLLWIGIERVSFTILLWRQNSLKAFKIAEIIHVTKQRAPQVWLAGSVAWNVQLSICTLQKDFSFLSWFSWVVKNCLTGTAVWTLSWLVTETLDVCCCFPINSFTICELVKQIKAK